IRRQPHRALGAGETELIGLRQAQRQSSTGRTPIARLQAGSRIRVFRSPFFMSKESSFPLNGESSRQRPPCSARISTRVTAPPVRHAETRNAPCARSVVKATSFHDAGTAGKPASAAKLPSRVNGL